MKLEEIIKILWRRKFYILLPIIMVPSFSISAILRMEKEYDTYVEIFMDQTELDSSIMRRAGLSLNLEERFLTIKQIMKGDETLFYILGEEKRDNITNNDWKRIEKKKEGMLIELKGPGIVGFTYSGTNPKKVKQTAERMAEIFIKLSLSPYKGIEEKLKRKLSEEDLILSRMTIELDKAKAKYFELNEYFTEENPTLVVAKYGYEKLLKQIKAREEIVKQEVYEAIPIIDGDLDVPKLVNVIVPARLPSIPSKPNKIQLIVIAITGGIVIGFILVFAMEFFDHSLKESRDVEKYLKLPVAGRIPRIEFKKRKNKKS